MDPEAQFQLFRRIPYFRALSLEQLAELLKIVRVRPYRKGQMIFRKGDRGEGLFVVLSGRVRTSIASEDGREQVLKVFGPGRTFGEVSVFDDEPQPADATAIADSSIAVVPQAELIAHLKSHPDAAIEVIRLLASRLRAYKTMVEDLSLRSVTVRVARLLVDRARGIPALVEEAPTRRLNYSQEEIAGMVGSVREVVHRSLKTLEHAGLVEIDRGGIQVIDVEALSGWTVDHGVVARSSAEASSN